jgi:hypothetical protein
MNNSETLLDSPIDVRRFYPNKFVKRIRHKDYIDFEKKDSEFDNNEGFRKRIMVYESMENILVG